MCTICDFTAMVNLVYLGWQFRWHGTHYVEKDRCNLDNLAKTRYYVKKERGKGKNKENAALSTLCE